MTENKADPLREAWLRRLAKIANSMSEAMSQGGNHKIFVDPEKRDDLLSAVAALAAPQPSADPLREALQQVYDFMSEDQKSADSDLWTIEYAGLFATVEAALARPAASRAIGRAGGDRARNAGSKRIADDG